MWPVIKTFFQYVLLCAVVLIISVLIIVAVEDLGASGKRIDCKVRAENMWRRCMSGVTEADAIRACSEFLENEQRKCEMLSSPDRAPAHVPDDESDESPRADARFDGKGD